MKIAYEVFHVFTTEKGGGNPLAIVDSADALDDAQMQAIAKELNLSETIFIRNPESSQNAAAVRIFTPWQELPFAGHPTVGVAVYLGLKHQSETILLEEKIGLVRCNVQRDDDVSGRAGFTLPNLPEKVDEPLDPHHIAGALGIAVGEIGFDGHAAALAYSAGVHFHIVPLRDESVLSGISPNADAWQSAFPGGRHAVYLIAPGHAEDQLCARMIKLTEVIFEDPATGSAAAAAIGYLSDHARNASGMFKYSIIQGKEMGRESCINIWFEKSDGKLADGGIAGSAVKMSTGMLDIQ